MKRSIIGTTLALSLALLAGPAAGEAEAACSAPVKSTAYDNPNDAEVYGNIVGNNWWAQSFSLSAPITLNKVSLYVYSNGGFTQPLFVEIHSDSNGVPGAQLATRNAILTNTTPDFAEFDFSADRLFLSSGTPYYIVAHSGTQYSWGLDQNATYSGGAAFAGSSTGGWGTFPSEDFLFQVFGQTCTADPKPGGGKSGPLPQATASNLAFSNATFAAENSGPSATNTRKKAPRGTKVSFKLNEAATVRFTITQRTKGRKVKRGRKTVCVKPTRKNRKRRRCTRVVTLKGSFSRNGVAGKNSFHFTGRLRGRKLKPGRYRLVATPTAGGKTGKPTSTGFRIVR